MTTTKSSRLTRLLAVVVIAATVVMLAACTDSSPSTKPSATATTHAPTAAASSTTAPPTVDPSLPPMARLYETLRLDPATAGLFAAAAPPMTYDETYDVLVADPAQLKTLMADAVVTVINANAGDSPLRIDIQDKNAAAFLAKLKPDVTLFTDDDFLTPKVAALTNVTGLALNGWLTTPLPKLPHVQTLSFFPSAKFRQGQDDRGYDVYITYLTKNSGLKNLFVYTDGGAFGAFYMYTKATVGKLKALRSVWVGTTDGKPTSNTYMNAVFYKTIKEYCPKIETINGGDAATFDPTLGLSEDDLSFYIKSLARDTIDAFRAGEYKQVASIKIDKDAVIAVDHYNPHLNSSSRTTDYSFSSTWKGFDAFKGPLADSPTSAGLFLLIYGKYTRVGTYGNGGGAFRTDTYVTVIDSKARTATRPHLVGTTNPPKKITIAPGSIASASGDLLVDKAIKYLNGLVA